MTRLPDSVWRLRKRKVIEVIAKNGSYFDIGEAWGTSNVYANRQVRERWPHLANEMKARRFKNELHPEVIYQRLLIIKDSRTQREAAKRIGITHVAVHQLLRRHAPDGIDDALDLYGG